MPDLDTIFQLFSHAIHYQEKNGFQLWPQFSREMIENEIKEKRHWKILENEKAVCVFSVMYNDPVIWGEMDKDPSVYLHRIAINPEFKGKRIMTVIKHWALLHAKKMRKKYLRMDTWGNNETLRNYYIKCGFNYIGQQQLTRTEGLPEHYGGNLLSLFQNEV
jgi:RimJ/RimL family protein N-acetyltransferase